METHRLWFLALCEEKAQSIDTPLGKDEWSITQIIDHLVTVEENIVPTIEKAHKDLPPPSLAGRIRFTMVNFVLSFGIKVPVPSERALPKGSPLPELLKRWEAVRATLKTVLDQKKPADISKFTFNHPIAGDLNVGQTVYFLSNHLKYHIVRAKRLILKRHIYNRPAI